MRRGVWVLCLVLLAAWPAAAGSEFYHRVAVEFVSGSKVMTVTDAGDQAVIRKVEMDVAPQANEWGVFVPLRFAAEGLGYKVNWDGNKRMVVLKRKTSLPGAIRDIRGEPLDNPLWQRLGLPANPHFGVGRVDLQVKNKVAVIVGGGPGDEINWEGISKVYAINIVPPGRVLIDTPSLSFILAVHGHEDPADVPPDKKTAGLAIDLVSE